MKTKTQTKTKAKTTTKAKTKTTTRIDMKTTAHKTHNTNTTTKPPVEFYKNENGAKSTPTARQNLSIEQKKTYRQNLSFFY